ncbi:MAG: hypothetical protein OXF84_02615 [Bacteroidetes bacterium]|nr:hypothetical protein [Bacteroidota bacterium]
MISKTGLVMNFLNMISSVQENIKSFNEYLEQQARYQAAKTKALEDRNKHRYMYANRFMKISYISLIFGALMIIADGIKMTGFDLSNSVIIALLGTALSTVFAPTYLLAKYLFKHDEDIY